MLPVFFMGLGLLGVGTPGLMGLISGDAPGGRLNFGYPYAMDLAVPFSDGQRLLVGLLFLGTSGVMLLGYLGGLRGLSRLKVGGTAGLWGACLAMTALALIIPPYLSRDIMSYMARGEVLAALGLNPHVHAPAEVLPNSEVVRWDYWRDWSSAYGFVWTWVSSWLRMLCQDQLLLNVYLHKLVSALGHVVTLVLLWHLWPRDDHRGRLLTVAIYGLNPITFIETSGQGHTEGLMVPLWLGAALATQRGRGFLGGLLLGLATGVKPIPIATAPLFFLHLWRGENRWLRIGLLTLGLGIGVVLPAMKFDPLDPATRRGIAEQAQIPNNGSLAVIVIMDIQLFKGDDTYDPRAQVLPTLRGIGVILLLLTLGHAAFKKKRGLEEMWPHFALIGLIFMLVISAYYHPWDVLWTLPWAVLARRQCPRLSGTIIALSLAGLFFSFTSLVGGFGTPMVQVSMFFTWALPMVLAALLIKQPGRLINPSMTR